VKNPAVSVVVPSHARRLRLRWLLNALQDQTLAPERFEVIVVHDYVGDDAELLASHPLAAAGRLREIRIEPGTGSPSLQRNLGWRAAAAPVVAFVDDDCRPEQDWLERLLEVADAYPDAIVQGATKPDPFERALRASPHYRSLTVTPPHDYAQTCNILYPVDLLERMEGFDEDFPAPAGEDTDLAQRALAAGTELVAAPDAHVYHAIEPYTLPTAIRLNWKWRHLAYVVKKHPQLRKHFWQHIFWRRRHRDVLLLLVGAAAATRFPPALLLAGPWAYRRVIRRGRHKRALVLGVIELPGGLVVDVAEVATMCCGSIRYRTVLL
jgi:GT2 family glycosyltransferase